MRVPRTLELVITRLLFCCLVFTPIGADKILKQVHVVTRHGSRLELYKNSKTLAESGVAALTPLGEKQCFDQGSWMREYFGNRTTFFDVFNISEVSLVSSSFDRTIVSANQFLLGLYPFAARDPLNLSLLTDTPANVPVYTLDLKDDVTIRAYDKCTKGLNLEGLYVSATWTTLEGAHYTLLKMLASFSEFEEFVVDSMIPLYNLWNVFDAISVATTECNASATSPYCTQSTADLLNASDWIELQELTRVSEEMKYGSDTAAKLVGGNLLLQIINTMTSSNSTKRFYLYSAHYPTLLGLFAALKEPRVDYDALPPYASILLFQLYYDSASAEQTVEVLYKAGDNSTYQTLTLSQVCSFQQCTLGTFALPFTGLTSMAQWCDTCDNHDAKPCVLLDAARAIGISQCSTISVGAISGIAIATFVMGLLGAVFLVRVVMLSQRHDNISHMNDATREENIPVEANNDIPAVVA